jgi:tetratricopeptide (TPR) repeat protein
MGEFPEAEGEAAPDAAMVSDSAGVGMALDRARRRRGGKAVDAAADRFLAAQEALISDQRHHLHEQLKQMRLKHFSERLKVTMQLMTIGLGVLAVATLAWMAFDASRADGVVIKPFTVAPDLARRGVTGEVVASQLLDKLTEITDRSQSSAALGKFGTGFGQSLSLQIPETGVSLGEVDRWLRDRLGHEQTLTGEAVVNPDGTVTLSARLDAKALPPQTGSAVDLPALIQRTAEALYRREQPLTYVQYLNRIPERQAETAELSRELTDSRDPVMRAYGYGGLGIAAVRRGDLAEAIRNYRRADAENAGLSWPLSNLAATVDALGHGEDELRLYRTALALTPHDPAYTPQAAREAQLREEGQIAYILHDHASELAKRLAISKGENLGYAGTRASLQASVAADRADAHDGLRAEADATAFEPHHPADVFLKADWLARIAYSRRDWATFLSRVDMEAKLAPQVVQIPLGKSIRAGAMSQAGHIPEAAELIAETPLDCQPCVVVRGSVANAAGRHAESDHWFAEASRMAPSIPNGPLAWGEALMVRGDPARAAVQFREALRRSPRAEEAMVGLGEALLAQGDAAGAVQQFVAADKLTPLWGRLHLKLGQALAKQGRAADARAQFATAARLDLTAAERAELAQVSHG